MSRIGKAPVAIPAGVTVEFKDKLLTVKGPLGTLTQEIFGDNSVKKSTFLRKIVDKKCGRFLPSGAGKKPCVFFAATPAQQAKKPDS